MRRPATEANDKLTPFDLRLSKIVVASPGSKISDMVYPLVLQNFANWLATAAQVGWDKKRLLHTNWNHWAPRIEFALCLDRRSEFVPRGSHGIFYSYSPYYTLGNFNGGIPFSLTS